MRKTRKKKLPFQSSNYHVLLVNVQLGSILAAHVFCTSWILV